MENINREEKDYCCHWESGIGKIKVNKTIGGFTKKIGGKPSDLINRR
jgi:hypothetical protein